MRSICFLLLILSEISFGQTQIGENIVGENMRDQSGYSIDLSQDGQILAIGSHHNGNNGYRSGHVRIFQNIGNSWVQLGSDIQGESSDDNSGRSVAISNDNNIIVAIGSPYNEDNGTDSGQVRVYRYANQVWNKIGNDLNGEQSYDLFGISVNLSENGDILSVGAPRNDSNGNQNAGHIKVYQNINENWVQLGESIEGNVSNSDSGFFHHLSADGLTIAVGEYRNSIIDDRNGRVRVFRLQNNLWTQIGQDIDGEVRYDEFGFSVALSADGSTLAAGARETGPKNDNNGYVKVYKYSNGTWNSLGSTLEGDVQYGNFGGDISLSANGNVLSVSASQNDTNGSNSGLTKIFQLINQEWIKVGENILGQSNWGLGHSVKLSSNGKILAISSPFSSLNATNAGHVSVYDLEPILNLKDISENNIGFYPIPTQTYLKLMLEGETEVKKIDFFNMNGKLVYSLENFKVEKIDISFLQTGVYLAKILTVENKVFIEKIIKK